MKALLLFGITIIVLAVIGILRIFNTDGLYSELASLRKSNILLQNVLTDIEYTSLLDSSKSYEEFILSLDNLDQNIVYINEDVYEGVKKVRVIVSDDVESVDKVWVVKVI